jgi:hypothetical protein
MHLCYLALKLQIIFCTSINFCSIAMEFCPRSAKLAVSRFYSFASGEMLNRTCLLADRLQLVTKTISASQPIHPFSFPIKQEAYFHPSALHHEKRQY